MFKALINRSIQNTPWQKIPWHDPEFSRRMLAEHLNQTHDLASRRLSTIDRQVEWIHHKILSTQPAKILDLGCGPGFYTGRLTARGHVCTGIDFSPASIEYAREHYPGAEYRFGSVLEVDYGSGYDLAMMIYGEINAFSPTDAACIMDKAYAALKPGGRLLMEVHPMEVVYREGHQPSSWYTSEKGLFSDEPYLCLAESCYEFDHAVTHFYVYTAESGEMQQYTTMLQCYTSDEYRHLLRAFAPVLFYPALTGDVEAGDLFVIVAEK